MAGLPDHVHIRVRDVDASRRFYAAIAEALELGPLSAGKEWFQLGELFVSDPPTAALHFAFRAADRQAIERFHERTGCRGTRQRRAGLQAALPPRLLRGVRGRPRRQQRRGRRARALKRARPLLCGLVEK